MLQRLSYFNLIFTIIYLLVYLKDGTVNSTLGILAIIIFNWLALRSFQLENYKWKIWHYLAGLWSLYYAGFVLYGAFNILLSSIEYEFISSDTRMLLILSFVFGIGVIVHFGVYFFRNLHSLSAR
ncbi:hypothetical protein [Pedobacter namyangjuensis]|uniref:hypothetical protein n=1 Tax=Pedobacter namyangjuensis TaxID=600626 RepID=UPI000DE25D9C|nr:hypothetical protein [Pedobacter namyangjuensis]